MKKILADATIKATNETALQMAVFAKNCLMNNDGFAPIQIVLGELPRLPSVLSNQPPALEPSPVSETVANHINCLIGARKAFLECENSMRIKRALKAKIG